MHKARVAQQPDELTVSHKKQYVQVHDYCLIIGGLLQSLLFQIFQQMVRPYHLVDHTYK